MHWKIKRDYYYKDLYELLGPEGIEEAGYFDDTAQLDYNIAQTASLLCTPLAPVSKGIHTTQKPCVLLTTGSFCPIHQGHIEMMSMAREAVKTAGFDALGGYISPGHDEYIHLKVKDKAIPIHYRLQMIQDLIERNGLQDWLMPDPWEGVFNAVAVNFTDVLYRLEMYLEHHFGQKIPVFFVCGGDNARFALTFLQKGHCVVVGRPNYDDRFDNYKKRLAHCKNVLWAAGDNDLSSTQIRNQKTFVANPLKELHLRVEGEDQREAALIDLLKPYFKKIKYAHVATQRANFEQINKAETVSLDAYIPGTYNLALSRVYDIMGWHKLGYTNRPGSSDLQTQVQEIPKGAYCLFDDDIHTGQTIKKAQDLLEEQGSQVLAIVAMNLYQKNYEAASEVLDCRDFLIGGPNNGLVVKVLGKEVRVPYIYPYVCPFARASIAAPLDFSIAVWQMNRAYFEKNNQVLATLPLHIRTFYEYMGFDKEDLLSTICQWHVDYLNTFLS